MHGPLNEIGLIEVLQLLARGKRSGLLRLVGAESARSHTIHLQDGRIVALEPDAGDDAVMKGLVRRHLLSTSDVISIADVDAELVEATRNAMARNSLDQMLHWTRGRFDFSEGTTATGPLDYHVDELLFMVVDEESRRVELAGLLHNWHGIPRFAPVDQPSAGATIELDPLEWRLLDLIDGQRDVAALAAALDESLNMVGARVRSLVAAAILQLDPPPREPNRAAREAIEAGRYEEAVMGLRQRLAEAPNDAEAWRTLGLAEVGAGRFERALEAWNSWREIAPARAADADALIRAAETMMEALRETRD